MKITHLVSMTDFVLMNRLSQEEIDDMWLSTIQKSINEFYDLNYRYAEFLKQTPEMWMFVPCNEYGEIYETDGTDGDGFIMDEIMFNEYQRGKRKVLFEGFKVKTTPYDETGKSTYIGFQPYEASIFLNLDNEGWKMGDYLTIEKILQSLNEIKLSETAIKQIYK